MSWHTRRDVLDRAPTRGSSLDPVPPIPSDVGLSASDRADLAGRLSRALAETYSLYLETVGPIYFNLDELTREQYEALIPAIDETAECIRSIGRQFPAFFATDPDPSEEDEERAPTGHHDDGEGEAEEGVATFTRRLRAVLGIPVDSEVARSVHLRS